MKAKNCPSLRTAFAQITGMENQSGSVGIKGLVRWAITPPQSYAIYLICLFLVAALSFYVGTLKPKKPVGMESPPVSVPRN